MLFASFSNAAFSQSPLFHHLLFDFVALLRLVKPVKMLLQGRDLQVFKHLANDHYSVFVRLLFALSSATKLNKAHQLFE